MRLNQNHCFTRDKARKPISSRRDCVSPPCLKTCKPKTECQYVLSTRVKSCSCKNLFVFKDLLVAPSQVFSSWSIKEKTPFSKAGLVSFLQTNLATEVGLLQNYSCTFFLTSNQLSGLRQQPQNCMDCSLNLRLQQVSGSCPVKIIYYQSGLFRSLLFSKWITQNLGILL